MTKMAILGILRDCASAGYALSRPTLKTQTQHRLGGQRIGDNDFDDAIRELMDKGYVDTRKAPVTEDTLYFITGPGLTALSQ